MPTEEQVKDQAQQQQGQEQARDGKKQGQSQGQPGQPGPGIKDRDAENSNSYGHTRESGETPK